MNRPQRKRESFEELDGLAHRLDDVRPLGAAMRRAWNAAKRTPAKRASGRPRKDPRLKSRIVPISIDPQLLAQIDRYAKSAGISRSRLVAEGLRMRMKV